MSVRSYSKDWTIPTTSPLLTIESYYRAIKCVSHKLVNILTIKRKKAQETTDGLDSHAIHLHNDSDIDHSKVRDWETVQLLNLVSKRLLQFRNEILLIFCQNKQSIN